MNMIVTAPRWTNAKMEISKDESLNPLKQNAKKGRLRYMKNCFPHHGYLWNYGVLPQTWEDSRQIHSETNARGPNDLIGVFDISEEVGFSGQVKQVKVLGALAVIENEEINWRIIVIDALSPNAAKLDDVADIDRVYPSLLSATREWLIVSELPDGKPAKVLAFDGHFKDKLYTMDVILNSHDAWVRIIRGQIPSWGLSMFEIALTEAHPDFLSRAIMAPPAFPLYPLLLAILLVLLGCEVLEATVADPEVS
ncbi:hypothetical protein HWV62_6761 [Athelia sp. TMB]|nr:hypothetical protein HWV62_6761 [Athelia sp. TMB]